MRANFQDLDLTLVGQGMQEDCPRQEFAGNVAAMEPVADRLNLSTCDAKKSWCTVKYLLSN